MLQQSSAELSKADTHPTDNSSEVICRDKLNLHISFAASSSLRHATSRTSASYRSRALRSSETSPTRMYRR